MHECERPRSTLLTCIYIISKNQKRSSGRRYGLCSIFSQSKIWSVMNLRHPSVPINSSLVSSRHPFTGMSFRKGMVMSGMQSLRTLFIAFTMCATELVPPCGKVHIRTRPRGVRIVVMSLLLTTSWNWSYPKYRSPTEYMDLSVKASANSSIADGYFIYRLEVLNER